MSSALRTAARLARRLPTSRLPPSHRRPTPSSFLARRSYGGSTPTLLSVGTRGEKAAGASVDDSDGGIVFASYGTDGVGRSNVSEEEDEEEEKEKDPSAGGGKAQEDGRSDKGEIQKDESKKKKRVADRRAPHRPMQGSSNDSSRATLLNRVRRLNQNERYLDALSLLEDEFARGGPVRSEDFKSMAISLSQHRNDTKRRRGNGAQRGPAQQCRIDDVIEA